MKTSEWIATVFVWILLIFGCFTLGNIMAWLFYKITGWKEKL